MRKNRLVIVVFADSAIELIQSLTSTGLEGPMENRYNRHFAIALVAFFALMPLTGFAQQNSFEPPPDDTQNDTMQQPQGSQGGRPRFSQEQQDEITRMQQRVAVANGQSAPPSVNTTPGTTSFDVRFQGYVSNAMAAQAPTSTGAPAGSAAQPAVVNRTYYRTTRVMQVDPNAAKRDEQLAGVRQDIANINSLLSTWAAQGVPTNNAMMQQALADLSALKLLMQQIIAAQAAQNSSMFGGNGFFILALTLGLVALAAIAAMMMRNNGNSAGAANNNNQHVYVPGGSGPVLLYDRMPDGSLRLVGDGSSSASGVPGAVKDYVDGRVDALEGKVDEGFARTDRNFGRVRAVLDGFKALAATPVDFERVTEARSLTTPHHSMKSLPATTSITTSTTGSSKSASSSDGVTGRSGKVLKRLFTTEDPAKSVVMPTRPTDSSKKGHKDKDKEPKKGKDKKKGLFLRRLSIVTGSVLGQYEMILYGYFPEFYRPGKRIDYSVCFGRRYYARNVERIDDSTLKCIVPRHPRGVVSVFVEYEDEHGDVISVPLRDSFEFVDPDASLPFTPAETKRYGSVLNLTTSTPAPGTAASTAATGTTPLGSTPGASGMPDALAGIINPTATAPLPSAPTSVSSTPPASAPGATTP